MIANLQSDTLPCIKWGLPILNFTVVLDIHLLSIEPEAWGQSSIYDALDVLKQATWLWFGYSKLNGFFSAGLIQITRLNFILFFWRHILILFVENWFLQINLQLLHILRQLKITIITKETLAFLVHGIVKFLARNSIS